MSLSEVQIAKRSRSHQPPFDSFAYTGVHVAIHCPLSLQGQDWWIRREGTFWLSLWTPWCLWCDEGQLFLACKDSGANFHSFIQRVKWKYWTWKVPVWGGLRYKHNTESYTILGNVTRTNGLWLLFVSSCSLKEHQRWGWRTASR